jgi:hypothetical protein
MPKSREKSRTASEALTAVGIIIPVQWDERGSPTAIAIATYNEKEYLIDEGNDLGKSLHNAIHDKIRIVGVLGKKVQRRRMLTVQQYERI